MKAIVFCVAAFVLLSGPVFATPLYTLVQGADQFRGSISAWHLLEQNGFVVTDPDYSEMDEAYKDLSMPLFITPDSAWDIFQYFAAGGIKGLETNSPAAAKLFGRIPDAAVKTGLEFFVRCPELRSPAAVQAYQNEFGNAALRDAESVNYSIGDDSLAAQSLRLLAKLQTPISTNLPAAFHTEAWASLQLWSQLGAWSEFGHMRKVPYIGPGNQEFDPFHRGVQGVVAPYPDFFAGLAKLSRQMAAAAESAGLDEKYDEKSVARKLLDACSAIVGFRGQSEPSMIGSAASIAQLNDFVTEYGARRGENHGIREGPNGPQTYNEFIAIARRCIDGADSTDSDRELLKKFFDARITLPRLLVEFADCCDKLAQLARKNIDGAQLTAEDEQWIAGYGALLEHFYQGSEDSYSLSTLRKLDGGQKSGEVRWAGLGNCASLYIILPWKGRFQIYRGAVLAYREFDKPESDKLDDKTWRDLTAKGDVPPPPAFTLAFRAEKNVADILDEIAFETSNPTAESYRDTPELLQELHSRARDADVPTLVDALPKIGVEGDPGVADGVAACVASLNWRDRQGDIVRVINQDDGARAKVAASILFTHPEWVDGNLICADYTNSSPESRVVCAGLLGRISPTPQTRAVLLRALKDAAAAVRWAAIFAIDAAPWEISEKTPPLLERLNDTNYCVAAASAFTLGNIGATNAAPVLYTNLQQRLQDPPLDAVAASEQYGAILNETPRFGGLAQSNFYDPYQLLSRAQNLAARRFPAMEEREMFTPVSALIEALGKLHYQPATQLLLDSLTGKNAAPAAHALKILAPEKLLPRLIAVAVDKTAPVANRDEALALLGEVGSPDVAAAIVPLLDDRTGVPGFRPMPGREWRVCDRAALAIAALLGRQLRMAPIMPTEMRDQQIEQVRQWVKAAY
jgi:HEAT repeat protein